MFAKEGSSCRAISIWSWQRCRNSCPIFPNWLRLKNQEHFSILPRRQLALVLATVIILLLLSRGEVFFDRRTFLLASSETFPIRNCRSGGGIVARKVVRITFDRGDVRHEFRNVCTPGILDVCKMAGHTCVTQTIVLGYIQEDQRSQRDGNSAIRINMQSAIPAMCAHVGGWNTIYMASARNFVSFTLWEDKIGWMGFLFFFLFFLFD